MSTDATTATLGHRYSEWTRAVATHDWDAFRAMLDQRWFGIDREGTTRSAADARAFAEASPKNATLAEYAVKQHGDFAIVRGTLRSLDDNGEETRFVALWHAVDATWLCLTHHDTRVVDSAFAEKPATSRVEAEPLDSIASRAALDELNAIYDELHRAMPAQDLDYLDRVIDDEWFTTDPGGEVRDKDQYMDFARRYYAPTLTFDVGELFVRETEPFAVVSCRYTLGGRFRHGVAPNQAVRVTGIWKRNGDTWAYVAQQGSFIP
jgi:ketosteroid isomerase-like protein